MSSMMNHDDPARCRCIQCIKRIHLAYHAGPPREGMVWGGLEAGRWVDAPAELEPRD